MENTIKYILVIVAIVAVVAFVSMITNNAPSASVTGNMISGNVVADDVGLGPVNLNWLWQGLVAVGLLGACIYMYKRTE